MIKEIDFIQYKKLKNVTLTFKEGINAISGENGTCKSSLLYLISNSFQAVSAKCEWVKEPAALNIIRAVNAVINPKMESLQRECLLHGDEKYRDPAHGVSGTFTLFLILEEKRSVLEGIIPDQKIKAALL